MSNENKSIHEFDFNLICEYFSSIERQGPGSPEATLRALKFAGNTGENALIADIGCGTGAPTFVLAQQALGHVTGIDLFPAFINRFNSNAAAMNLQNRVKGVVGSMENLPFGNEELDMIWSEGAIYNIGFERGLNEWRKFLKKGGCIAVTDASWFTVNRPAEIDAFWNDAYPGIGTIAQNVAFMQDAGYVPEAVFILPENCWTDHFYALQVNAQEVFLKKYSDNKTALDMVAYQRYEAQMYNRFKKYYGYVFYIGRKI
jgi:SAM-dependent methyltransferase